MYGKVTAYFHGKGHGFIQGTDNQFYFIHRSNLKGESIEKGCYVQFKPFVNDRSDCNAGNVIGIEAPERRRKNVKKHK